MFQCKDNRNYGITSTILITYPFSNSAWTIAGAVADLVSSRSVHANGSSQQYQRYYYLSLLYHLTISFASDPFQFRFSQYITPEDSGLADDALQLRRVWQRVRRAAMTDEQRDENNRKRRICENYICSYHPYLWIGVVAKMHLSIYCF